MNVVQRLIEADTKLAKHIVVIGDSIMDVYIYGTSSNCQDGCNKFIEEKTVVVPGGAANAGRSLHHWNAKVTLIPDGLPGPVKTRFVVDNNIVFRWDNDECDFDVKYERLKIPLTLAREKPDAILISDYDKGLLTLESIRCIAEYCRLRNIPCVSDAKRPPHFYEGTIIKGNGAYFSVFAEQARKYDTQAVTTYGSVSPIVWDCGRLYTPVIPDRYTPCINHVGAGDCFAAHFTLALAHGFSLKDAATAAHYAGRAYVQKPHNTPPTLADVLADVGVPAHASV